MRTGRPRAAPPCPRLWSHGKLVSRAGKAVKTAVPIHPGEMKPDAVVRMQRAASHGRRTSRGGVRKREMPSLSGRRNHVSRARGPQSHRRL